MIKFLVVTPVAFVFLLLLVLPVQASTNSFVTIVNPIRGDDFWDLKNQKPKDAIAGQMEIIKSSNLEATWLIRPDALKNSSITEMLKAAPSNHELGLFLEITPSWTSKASVEYRRSTSWHNAGSVFLTGYTTDDRKKLIDTAFEEFKKTFGYYPKSVGAWFVDSFSLAYMQDKYEVDACLIVADQYSTDNYQIWGQFWGTPYYPQKRNTLAPAQNKEDKLSVVVMQWATRDPVNGYGKAVEESTYSVQANDYVDYHNLDTSYFSKLVDIYTNQKNNQLNHLVVGLENSYAWQKYKSEYASQIKVLTDKSKKGQFSILTMRDFANWYKAKFPDFSPEQIIIANDPLGSDAKVVWFMNRYYRSAWFSDSEGSVLRDIRQYLEFQEQLCFDKPCRELNFATSATRVLDDVSFRQKWILDEGRIQDVKVTKQGQNYLISYINDAGNLRKLEFLPRDLAVDGKISTIDGAILDATKKSLENTKSSQNILNFQFRGNYLNIFFGFIKFLLFLILGILIPGFFIVKKFLSTDNLFSKNILLSFAIGTVLLTLVSYILGFLHIYWLIYLYIAFFISAFFYFKVHQKLKFPKLQKTDYLIIALVVLGTSFQLIPVFRSGLNFSYGVGFWGPNGHDAIWHLSLINELAKGLPPQNPVFSGEKLVNYHYLYDLLVTSANNLTKIEVSDLFFRFFPLVFSLLLGISIITFMKELLGDKIDKKFLSLAILFGLYFTYFAGSFGWIVTYLKDKVLSGESAFWVNQSISYNLNPPFAISLILFFASIILIKSAANSLNAAKLIISSLLIGSLVGFKAYGAILIIGTLGIFSLIQILFRRKINLLALSLGSVIISLGVYLPNFKYGDSFIYAPFWLIHTMIDSLDRVGWLRLSAARSAYLERGEWLKFFLAELLGLIMFIFGNIGVRLIGLIGILKLNFKNFLFQFLLLLSVFSLLIPILIIQQGTPWNTVQFIYYFLYISAIFSGVGAALIYQKLPKLLGTLVLTLAIILTPINSFSTARGYLYASPHTFISSEELDALEFLRVQPEGVALTYPYDKDSRLTLSEPLPLLAYETSSYVSAYSKKRVFLEDEIQSQLLNIDYKKRRVAAKDFFYSKGIENSEFLKSNDIKYIYLPKFYKINLEESESITKIFDNKEVMIYLHKN